MDPNDLHVEPAYITPPGGQHVGMPRPDIKVTHLPSGNFVVVGSQRSRRGNLELAFSMLEWMENEMK